MLELRRVNASYGESHILRDVSMTVETGEVLCLMGRNGVGKTTTLKTIMGLMPVQSGEVRFEGVDLTKTPPDRRVRAGLGFVPQGREILPHLTVRENLRLGFWARPRTAPAISEEAAFKEVYALFPKLYQILDRPGGVLSGGSSNNWPLPGLCWPIQKSCCWMSRQKGSNHPWWIRSKT